MPVHDLTALMKEGLKYDCQLKNTKSYSHVLFSLTWKVEHTERHTLVAP